MVWAFMAFCSGSLSAQSIDEVVLIVNDQAVTANEFKSLARVQTIQAQGNLSAPKIGDPITEAIINDALMLSHIAQIAPDRQIPQSQLDSAIATLAAQNQISPQQLIAQLKSEGVDVEVFVDSIRNRLLIQNVISQPLSSRVTVSNSEIQEYILNRPELKAQVNNQYELYHMVVSVDEEDDTAKARGLDRIKQAKAKLIDGLDFETVLSETPEATSVEAGGYLGWKSTKDLPELFVWALEKLEAGQVSPVLESSNGLHLIKLVEKRGENRAVNEYQIRHILKRLEENEDPSSMNKQLLLLKEGLNNGGNFADVAAKESDDRGSAVAGGELGWVMLEALVPGFANAVTKLDHNTVSDPVRSRFGLHLIEVLGVREVQREFSELEAKARQQIFAEKVNSDLDDLLNDLRAIAVIEVIN